MTSNLQLVNCIGGNREFFYHNITVTQTDLPHRGIKCVRYRKEYLIALSRTFSKEKAVLSLKEKSNEKRNATQL